MGLKDWKMYETEDLLMLRHIKKGYDEDLQLSNERLHSFEEIGDRETYDIEKEYNLQYTKKVEAIDYLIKQAEDVIGSYPNKVVIKGKFEDVVLEPKEIESKN